MQMTKMRMKKAIVACASVLVLTGAVLGGVAVASSHGAQPKSQAGTATGAPPPVHTGNATARPRSRAGNAAAASESSSTDPDNVQQGDQTSPDSSGNDEGSDTELGAQESDGPGGHEDPPGNVDHQFEGEE
jgi:hypothetical protein